MNNAVFSYEIFVAGKPEWARTINARSLGQAKSEYWRELIDAWPDIPFTDIRGRKVGHPTTDFRFRCTAQFRGIPGVQCGDRVLVGDDLGTIVGSNASANFDVLFDLDSPKYPGLRLNVHPRSITIQEKEAA